MLQSDRCLWVNTAMAVYRLVFWRFPVRISIVLLAIKPTAVVVCILPVLTWERLRPLHLVMIIFSARSIPCKRPSCESLLMKDNDTVLMCDIFKVLQRHCFFNVGVMTVAIFKFM